MSAREYYDNLLEIARRLHKLGRLLNDIHQSRGESIRELIGDWKGEKPDAFTSRYEENHAIFGTPSEVGTASGDLRTYEQYWVDSWVTEVEAHNSRVRMRAVGDLQAALDLYHAQVVLEQNLLEAALNVLHRKADAVADLFGGVGLIVDDANVVVDQYRSTDTPTPPEYDPDPSFVGYERRNAADPRRGMYASYLHWPSER